MKKLLLLLALQVMTLAAVGQTFTITGTLQDAGTAEALPGAHLLLLQPDSTLLQTQISGTEGDFLLEGVQNGNYLLEVSFLGYESVYQALRITGQSINLGTIRLKAGVELTEIQVTEQVIPVQQQGDTTVFNAKAFKTLPDADAGELIEKMPTVVVENGKVQAQGEDVQRVLVDGKPFFGDDPTAALRNLPAEVIDKIQIFDEQSDQSRFTGFDDGQTTKTINIITKPDMRNGQFGKVYLGYGYDNKYQAGGNINIFNGDQRISLIGMSNNINQQNFSSEDLLGVVNAGSGGGRRGGGRGRRGGGPGGASSSDFLVNQQQGVATTHAGGINFTDTWGKDIEVGASYFFNRSDNLGEQFSYQQFFSDENLNERYEESSSVESMNLNHRFSGTLRAPINEKNTLTWRPQLSFQSNNGLEAVFGQNLLGSDTFSQTTNSLLADLQALNFSNDLNWQHKFDKQGRTISVRLNGGTAPKKGERNLVAENLFDADTAASSNLDQFAQLDLNNWNAAANLQYTEPIGEKSRLLFNYQGSYQQEESIQETYDFDAQTGAYDLFNQDLSTLFSNDYVSQSLGAGYQFRPGKLMIMTRANVQWANLINEQNVPFEQTYDKSFWNVLPSVFLRFRDGKTENLSVGYRTNTDLPSIEQLQNVIDNSNPLQLTVGNPELAQAFTHHLFGRYSKTNTETSSIFYVMLRASLTNDYIAKSQYLSTYQGDALDSYDIAEGVQLTLPENLDGQGSIRSFITYGMPLKAIQSNLNIDLSGSINRTPGLVNDALNLSNNRSVGLGLTLSSNISDRIDFTLSSRSNYNTVSNSLQTSNNTTFYNQNSKLKLNWIIYKGLTLRADLSHQYYSGFDDDFVQNFLLVNLSLGKKLFKEERGEISLSVFDLLKQNNSLNRTVTETYIQDVQTNVLQQFFMLNFKYDLRHFKIG